ncbi:MAG: glycosyl transferase, partial [Thermoleophilia bacterium]
FNGSDPYPTLAEFEALVGAGKVHYFIAGAAGGPGNAGTAGNTVGPMGLGATGGSVNGTQLGGGDSSMSAISAWVEAHFTSRTVGGITVYDLTSRSG